MIRFFPIVLALQAFCIWHAYKNRSEQMWYWLIFFLPLIGCLLYLYHHFYSRKNVEVVSEGIKEAVIKNYKIEKLEKELNFSDSVLNRTNLADEYMNIGQYQKAIELYNSCLETFDKDNPHTIKKLVECCYYAKDYEESVKWGNEVKNDSEFYKSEAGIFYAWSHFHLGKTELAEENFKKMDKSYSNYSQRVEYSKFLNQTDQKAEAKEKLRKLKDEWIQMTSYQKKFYQGLNRTIDNVMNEIEKRV